MIQFIITLFYILAFISSIVIIILFFSFFIQHSKQFINYIGKRALLFSFLISALATFGSLFFSEIAHFVPCKLCWLQRIFMYPQAVLLGLGFIRRDRRILSYTIYLSFIGGAIALYQYVLNWYAYFYPVEDACGLVSCIQGFRFGYINIPFMSLSAYILLIYAFIFSSLYEKTKDKKKHS